jgi:hypothetical protein
LYRLIKKINKSSKILLEIPTYPYEKEVKRLLDKMNLILDKILRNFLKKYIDRVVTFSNDDMIFCIQTIKIYNGIDFLRIPINIEKTYKENEINFVMTAQNYTFAQGCDRIIEGLYYYYSNTIDKKKIFFHIVGGGIELKEYKLQINNYNLEEYVLFYGLLSDNELNDVFKISEIGVCPLGSHRKKIFLGSFLKSREYIARGLPMVSSTKIDILPDDFPFIKYVPEDESPVDIFSIVDFYEKLKIKYSPVDLAHSVRLFGEQICDISTTMKPVIAYLLNKE